MARSNGAMHYCLWKLGALNSKFAKGAILDVTSPFYKGRVTKKYKNIAVKTSVVF